MSSPGGRTSQVGERRFRGLGWPELARCSCSGFLALHWGAAFASGSGKNPMDFPSPLWACKKTTPHLPP